MKRIVLIPGIILCLMMIVSARPMAGPGPTSFFQGSYDDMLREAKKEKKQVLLEFWAAWCGPCKKLEAETFSDKKLAAYLNENFMVYRLDIDSPDGMEIVEKFEVEVFPTMLVLDHYGQVMSRLKGFYSASYLEKTLRNTGENRSSSLEIPMNSDIVFNK